MWHIAGAMKVWIIKSTSTSSDKEVDKTSQALINFTIIALFVHVSTHVHSLVRCGNIRVDPLNVDGTCQKIS